MVGEQMQMLWEDAVRCPLGLKAQVMAAGHWLTADCHCLGVNFA